MKDGAQIPKGYQQTEVGVVPEDWDVMPLGQFLALRRGHDLTERNRRRGDVPVMGSAGLSGFHDTSLARGPGLVLGRSGASFGQAHYCQEDFWPHNTALYVTDFLGNHPLFSFFFLRSIDFTRHNSGGAQQSLNRNFIAPILVAIPKRLEQEAIAEALNDADAFIESLEQLLAKKRRLKQGVMQELLTGKRRLPGFSGLREIRRMGELVLLSKSGVNPGSTPDALFNHFSLPAFDSGAMPIVEPGSLIGSNKFVMPTGAVLFSKLNPRIPRIWAPSHIPNNAVCSTEFLVLIPRDGIDRAFLAATCRSEAVSYQMALHAIGTTGSHQRINPSQAMTIEVRIPIDKPEQAAIAAVLSDMDAEIAALEDKLAKARNVKQGMMQELLTGRIRLV